MQLNIDRTSTSPLRKDTGKSRNSRIMAAPLLLPSKSPFSDGIDEFQILLVIFLAGKCERFVCFVMKTQ